jgi:adenylate cyclase
MLQGLLERQYRRYGPAYIPRATIVQGLVICPLIFGGVWVVSAYVPMSFGQYVRLSLLGCALQVVYTLVSQRVVVELARPVTSWLEGARGERQTADAWQAAACLPWQFVRRTFAVSVLGVSLAVLYLIWIAYFASQVGLAFVTALLIYAGAVVLMAYTVLLRYFGVEQTVRPVLRDIAAQLPSATTARPPGLSMRARMLAALPAINVITAVVADAVTRHGDAHLGDLAYVVLIAAAVSATVPLVLTLLLADSITEPIGTLREAALRVGAGELDTRVPVITTDETGDLARSFNDMTAGLQERERIRETFGTYVDRDVAEHILREGTSLAGEEIELTALFLDIRNFTGFAERAPAPEVVATLNRLFERIVPIIHSHGGHVDKYVGDGLLAVFGAPRRQSDHADQALRAACEIAAAVQDEFGDGLGVGIGLNSGTVVAGNVGGAGRLEFSVIGDAVNVAARVESATRQTGDIILVSENTRRLLQDPPVGLDARPDVPLKGKSETVALYAPSSPVPTAAARQS